MPKHFPVFLLIRLVIVRFIAPISHSDHLCRDSAHNSIRRHIVSNHGTGGDDDAIADPHIIPDHNRALILKSLVHHRNIGAVKGVVACDDHNIRPHHHVIADGAGSVDSCIDTDTGVVSQGSTGGGNSSLFDIHILAAILQHPSTAKGPKGFLPQLSGRIRYRQMLSHRIIQQPADYSG